MGGGPVWGPLGGCWGEWAVDGASEEDQAVAWVWIGEGTGHWFLPATLSLPPKLVHRRHLPWPRPGPQGLWKHLEEKRNGFSQPPQRLGLWGTSPGGYSVTAGGEEEWAARKGVQTGGGGGSQSPYRSPGGCVEQRAPHGHTPTVTLLWPPCPPGLRLPEQAAQKGAKVCFYLTV